MFSGFLSIEMQFVTPAIKVSNSSSYHCLIEIPAKKVATHRKLTCATTPKTNHVSAKNSQNKCTPKCLAFGMHVNYQKLLFCFYIWWDWGWGIHC